jgi:hypothetical protein
MLEEEQKLKEEIETKRRAEEARKARLIAKAKYTTQTVSPFDVFQVQPVAERGWDKGHTLSEKQRSLLLKQGINPDGMPFGQARQLLNEIFRRWDGKLCSYKQAAWLSKHGYDAKNTTIEQASKIMDSWAKNGWRRPVEEVAA